jgi:predicted PurR-regulated permease PerM
MAAVPTPGPAAPVRVSALSFRVILRVVLTVVLVFMALWLIYVLRRPLTWIFIAGFLAIALAGPVNFLSRRMRRGFAVAIVYIGLILVPVLLAALLVPPVVEQLNLLIDNLPRYVADLQQFISENERLRELEQDYNITAELQKQASSLPGQVGDAAGILSDIGLGLVNSVFAGVTILVLSLFMINSGRGWLDWLAERQGAERSQWLRRLFDRVGNAVGNYVAGALGQAVLAGLLAYIVLLILGVPYAGSLAVVIFLLDLVPLVGATLGAVLVGIITVFTDFPTTTIVWTIWSIVYQQVENNIIQPRIQARAVQVHPFVVLVSVLFGSTLFGVLGALLAIPVAAALQIAIIEYNNFRRPENIGAVQAPPPAAEPPPPEPEPEPAG